jgi:fatty-acyl-CoA synthase
MTGNILHTINWRLSAAQILYTINHAEDALIICHLDFLPLLESLASELTTVKGIIVCTDGQILPQSDKLPILGEYETLLIASIV